MMELIESWRESLALLMPRQAKVMMLVTLKSLSDLFYNPFALLISTLLSICIAFSMTYCSQLVSYYSTACGLAFILSNILIVLIILYVRPSVMLKHRFYFMNYWGHILYIGLFYAFVAVINSMWMIPFAHVVWFVWAPLSTFWILFFVDRHVSIEAFIRSFMRAVKMLLYNLPACLIITALWYLFFTLFIVIFFTLLELLFSHQARHLLFFIAGSLVGIFFFPLWYCLMSNFYVKRLHDQFLLYFGRPIS